ncbi:Uncharacterised protein [Bifidobacterium breve]|nr:Uncharacterised protein [Bifidobacterium breve]
MRMRLGHQSPFVAKPIASTIMRVGHCAPWSTSLRYRPMMALRSALVGEGVARPSIERCAPSEARTRPAASAISVSSSSSCSVLFFSAAVAPLAGRCPVGAEGKEGLLGGFTWRVLFLYSSPAAFAVLGVQLSQCWRCEICSAGSGSFSSPARFAVLGIGFVPAFSGVTSLDSPFSMMVEAAGSTVLPMVFGSCSAVCVSLIHSRVDGSDSTARSHTIWQYWGRRFLPPLPRRAYRWSPRRMKPRSWRVFNAVRTVRSESSVTLTMVAIFG